MSGFGDKMRSYTSEAKLKNFQFSKEEVEKVFERKFLLEEVKTKIELSEELEKTVSYLDQCRQYVPEGDLKSEIGIEIGRLGEIIRNNDEKEIKQYEAGLGSLKKRYADYYMEQYTRYRISEKENTAKQALIDSDKKKICDILREAEFLSTEQYRLWLEQLFKLKPADSKVTSKAVLATPYFDFNPLDFIGKSAPTVKSLGQQLEVIYEQWIDALKDTIEDPAVTKNYDAISSDDQKLLRNFKDGMLQIDVRNALTIRNLLNTLYEGIDKIELSQESLKNTFNKPLTPDEAIDAFKKYLDEVTKGKDRNKVRIILK